MILSLVLHNSFLGYWPLQTRWSDPNGQTQILRLAHVFLLLTPTLQTKCSLAPWSIPPTNRCHEKEESYSPHLSVVSHCWCFYGKLEHRFSVLTAEVIWTTKVIWGISAYRLPVPLGRFVTHLLSRRLTTQPERNTALQSVGARCPFQAAVRTDAAASLNLLPLCCSLTETFLFPQAAERAFIRDS